MRALAAFIMRGRMQAMIVASTFAVLSLIPILLPPCFVLSSATVALVTLRNGAHNGLLVIAGACVAMAVFGIFLLNNAAVLPVYSLTMWLPVFLMALVLRETSQLALTIELSAAFAVVLIVAAYLVTSEPSAFWDERLRDLFEKLVKGRGKLDGQQVEQVYQNIRLASQYMTGIVASMALIGLTLGLLLGRWWQALLFNPGGFRAEFLNLTSHRVVAYAGLGLLIASLMSQNSFTEFARNVTMTLAVLFVFVGIAVLHNIFAHRKSARFSLPTFYFLLIFVPYTILPVTIIGFADNWLNWRNRYLPR